MGVYYVFNGTCRLLEISLAGHTNFSRAEVGGVKGPGGGKNTPASRVISGLLFRVVGKC